MKSAQTYGCYGFCTVLYGCCTGKRNRFLVGKPCFWWATGSKPAFLLASLILAVLGVEGLQTSDQNRQGRRARNAIPIRLPGSCGPATVTTIKATQKARSKQQGDLQRLPCRFRYFDALKKGILTGYFWACGGVKPYSFFYFAVD